MTRRRHRDATPRFASLRTASRRHASRRNASPRSAAPRLATPRYALLRCAPLHSAPHRIATLRDAPLRIAPQRTATQRNAAQRPGHLFEGEQMTMQCRTLVATVGLLAFAGCAGTERPSITSNYTAANGGLWVDDIKSTDMGTGPQQDILRIRGADGRPEYFTSSGHSTMQGMAEGLAGTIMPAMSFPIGMALRRPDQTVVTNNNSGGYVGPGAGSVAPGAVSATAAASPTALGGAGGQGGAGGRGGNATGGNAQGGAGGNAAASGGVGYGGAANSAAGSVSSARSASTSNAKASQGQGQTNNNFNGQWNCVNSPPCN